jgi:PIN domain nuclease of toxin-antitoxin system
MKYILDTHVFIWYATGDKRLTPRSRSIIESSDEMFVSIASIWEMAIKVNIGRLDFKKPFQKIIENQIIINKYKLLSISLKHLFKLSQLELHHRDPFDRLLVSQALTEKIPVVSVDEIFDKYGVDRIW